MNTAPQGFFSPKANDYDANSKLPNFPENFVGDVEVMLVKGITTREGVRAYVAELRVLTSNMPDKVFVGGGYSWFQSLKEEGTSYPACISFLYACLGLDPSNPAHKAKIDAEVKPKQNVWLNQSCNDNPAYGPVNILKGAKLRLQTALKTKKATKHLTIEEAKKVPNGVFTLHTFTPYVAPQAA